MGEVRVLARPPLGASLRKLAAGSGRPGTGGHVLYEPLKRAMDIIAALVGLGLGLPIMIVVAIAVFLDSPGPVTYRATRVGKGGRKVRIVKFRSMRPDSEAILAQLLEDPVIAAEYRSTFKLREDPRCTRVGRFLRRTSLDELPQLWNVLMGSMSLVGPRPIVAQELEMYRQVPGGEEAYLAVRPGLTGLWQVSGRSDTTYAERVRLDLEYVEKRSLRHDIDIALRTPRAALRGHGAY